MHQTNSHIDVDLILDLRYGSKEAFDKIFTKLYPALSFYSLQITGSQEAAEEIAGEAFVKIWERREMFFQFNVLKSYAYKIVKNDSLNWIRSESRRLNFHNKMQQTESATENTLWENLVHTELLRQLRNAMDQLPGKRKQIFKMLFAEGKSVKEVAQELELSISAVKDHKRAGIVFLRKNLSTLVILFCFVIHR